MFATYVDDIIVAGEEAVILNFYQKVRENWKIGEPSCAWVREGEEPVRFLGMEVEKRGRDVFIHQRAYLRTSSWTTRKMERLLWV